MYIYPFEKDRVKIEKLVAALKEAHEMARSKCGVASDARCGSLWKIDDLPKCYELKCPGRLWEELIEEESPDYGIR